MTEPASVTSRAVFHRAGFELESSDSVSNGTYSVLEEEKNLK